MSLDAHALSLEYVFARLNNAEIGGRGHSWDADTWRIGDPKEIAKVLTQTAASIERRVNALRGPESNGSVKARVRVAVDGMRAVAEDLSRSSVDTTASDRRISVNQDTITNWGLVLAALEMTAALFDQAEE